MEDVVNGGWRLARVNFDRKRAKNPLRKVT
jgi:hypothetical protein